MIRPAKIPLLFLLVTFTLLAGYGESRLNSGFPMSEPTEGTKRKVTVQEDVLSRQLTDGVVYSKKTTTICGLVDQERQIGQGIDLQPVYRNVKTCQITSLKTGNKIDQRSGVSCKLPQMCIANESSVEELALLKGQIELTSAHGCQCIDPQSRCHKQRNIQVYHWGTKYEKTVDVGRCVGSCHQKGKKSCQPMASKVVNVKGPNGAHCVEKVLECGCARSCYRMSFHQLYKTTIYDGDAGLNKTLEVVIDIGRCVGQCPKKKKARCLHWVDNPLWSPGSAVPFKVCLLSSPAGQNKAECRPRSFEDRALYPSNGVSNTVKVIKRCKCY